MAIELPEPVREALSRVGARLRQCPVRASWVRPEHMHLTLRFLGECDDEQAASFTTQLRARLANVRAFELGLKGVGAFPNLRKPGVVWAGAGPSDGALADVQRDCESAAQTVGLPPETKRFHPHITLARIKDRHPPEALAQAIAREHNFEASAFTVPGVSLFSSRLTPRGPVYTRLEEFRFE